MVCLCKLKIGEMARVFSSFNMSFSLPMPIDLPQLQLAMGKIEAINQASTLDTSALDKLMNWARSMMPLPFSPATALQFQALGLAVQGLKVHLGIDLMKDGLKVQDTLNAFATAVNANAPVMDSMLRAYPSSLLGLLPLPSLLQAAKARGVDLLSARADLMQLVPPTVRLVLPPMTPNLSVLLSLGLIVRVARLNFGIELLEPRGAQAMRSALDMMSRIIFPPLKINLPKLTILLAVATAIDEIKVAMGIDLLEPGAPAALALALKPLMSLKLPQIDVPMPAIPIEALSAALALPMVESADLSPLSGASLPNVGPFLTIGPLIAKLAAVFRIPLLVPPGCMPGACPIAG